MPSLPESVARLFGPAAETVTLETDRDFVIGKLLEEGDCADLTWLNERVEERGLVDWLERRGARQLSVRSLRFWETTLGLEIPGVKMREELWPL